MEPALRTQEVDRQPRGQRRRAARVLPEDQPDACVVRLLQAAHRVAPRGEHLDLGRAVAVVAPEPCGERRERRWHVEPCGLPPLAPTSRSAGLPERVVEVAAQGGPGGERGAAAVLQHDRDGQVVESGAHLVGHPRQVDPRAGQVQVGLAGDGTGRDVRAEPLDELGRVDPQVDPGRRGQQHRYLAQPLQHRRLARVDRTPDERPPVPGPRGVEQRRRLTHDPRGHAPQAADPGRPHPTQRGPSRLAVLRGHRVRQREEALEPRRRRRPRAAP